MFYLGAPITHLPILPHVIFSCPFYFAIFLGFLFIIFPFFSPFQCSTLPPSSPTLHHHLPLLHSFVTISSFLYASFKIISDFFSPYFSQPSFPFSFLLHIWHHIRLALFCNIVVIFLDFCTLQYLTILHLIYDAKYVYISSLFLECVGNNCLYIVFDIL